MKHGQQNYNSSKNLDLISGSQKPIVSKKEVMYKPTQS